MYNMSMEGIMKYIPAWLVVLLGIISFLSLTKRGISFRVGLIYKDHMFNLAIAVGLCTVLNAIIFITNNNDLIILFGRLSSIWFSAVLIHIAYGVKKL